MERYSTTPALWADATIIVDDEHEQQPVAYFVTTGHQDEAESLARKLNAEYTDAIERSEK